MKPQPQSWVLAPHHIYFRGEIRAADAHEIDRKSGSRRGPRCGVEDHGCGSGSRSSQRVRARIDYRVARIREINFASIVSAQEAGFRGLVGPRVDGIEDRPRETVVCIGACQLTNRRYGSRPPSMVADA